MLSSLRCNSTCPQRGAALIIILSFVVLLTGVVVAFFSRAISERQISNSSANEGKVELFAEGAMETTLGDLKQEIVAGSTTTKITTGTASDTLYFPTTNKTMLPCRVGTADTLPNLVKRSAYGQPFYSGTAYGAIGVSRAATTSSTTASLNFCTVTLSRWNKSLLLPKKTPGQAADLAPSPDFLPPDWIYVDRSGDNPTIVSSDIVGRYAYCIYDEGGVLDLNAAGYPSVMDKSQASRKNGTSFADLTQVGLTSAQADTLIAWRNYASIQPTGSFPSYNLSAQSGANYLQSILSNATGFLSTSNPNLYNGQSDRMFASRQQMMRFLLQGIASNPIERSALQDALQYLGTFSRSLEQPSFAPDADRRKVVGYDAAPVAGSGFFGTNSGGNNAYGLDDLINPAFLKVRATSAFSRNDGTTAVVGEALVKKRFALNRLAWLTYAGPSALRNYSNPSPTGSDADIWALENTHGFSKAWLGQGTAVNIAAYFGLTWDATNKLWKYDHGVISGMATGVGRLYDVQSMSRDADFVELLKAGINVGSLAKGAATNHSSIGIPNLVDVHQYTLDTSVNDQIIQITANIIDQFDSDGYPTHIQYDGNDFYGIENLPYLCRSRPIGINVSDTSGLMLLLPEVWNPHDPNSGVTSPTPTSFRFLLSGPSVTALGRTRVYPHPLDDGGATKTNSPSNLSMPVSLNANSTELCFTIPAGSSAASEPVFLGNLKNSSQATAISLTVGASHNIRLTSNADTEGFVTDTISGLSYCGVLLGKFPTTWVTGGTSYPLSVSPCNPKNPSSADFCQESAVTMADYILQYMDASGSWITYQDTYATLPLEAAVSVSSGGVSRLDISGIAGSANTGRWNAWMDPRTSHFGIFGANAASLQGPIYISENYYGKSPRPGKAFGQGLEFNAPGTGLSIANAPIIGWYPGNWSAVSNGSKLFVPAYYAENVIGNRPSPQGNANYFTDPDGVVRRGMGAYVAANPSNTVGMPMASLSTSTGQSQSRPFLLNRPYRCVAELGYVFSGTPWRNIDFVTPESGYAGLLDLFCINDPCDPNGMVAGKINLNTRQLPVLRATLSGINNQGNAYKDERNPGGTGVTDSLSSAEITQIAQTLYNRTINTTTSGQGSLCNISELVGKWNSPVLIPGALAPHNIDGSQSYTGFSADISNIFDSTDPSYSTSRIQRLRESAIRALSSSGQTRVWNLMIDLVAQTGRYRPNETSLDKFVVGGERRYWLHVAIDRYTGNIIDKQLELVKE